MINSAGKICERSEEKERERKGKGTKYTLYVPYDRDNIAHASIMEILAATMAL